MFYSIVDLVEQASTQYEGNVAELMIATEFELTGRGMQPCSSRAGRRCARGSRSSFAAEGCGSFHRTADNPTKHEALPPVLPRFPASARQYRFHTNRWSRLICQFSRPTAFATGVRPYAIYRCACPYQTYQTAPFHYLIVYRLTHRYICYIIRKITANLRF